MKKPKRILIADDDECLVDALARRCQALNFRVERAYDGMSALAKIDAWEPDLVILDVNMPSGSGLSVCEMLAHDTHLKTIPVIMLTGRSDGETIAACNRLKATYVLKGPSIWSELEPIVANFLGINPSAAAAEQQSPASACATNVNLGPPSNPNQADEAEPEAEAGRICDQYITELFTALGWREPDRAERFGDDRPEYAVTRPWVICVDDDPDFAVTLKLRLQQHGVDALHAFAGMEGYRFAFTLEAQAIILDQEMPDGNGEYILRRLKESPATEGIPVIVLTGTKDQALARRMYNLGARRFLTKPVDWDDLWAELDPLVHRERESGPLCQAMVH